MMKLWKKLDETSEEDLNCPNCGANLLFAMDVNGEVWITVPCESCGWEP